MRSASSLLCALVLTSASFAQNTLNLRLDTTALNGIAIDEAVPTADGGVVLMLPGTSGMSLWKCDANGTAQWRNSYPVPVVNGYRDIASCANGDVLLACASSQQTGWDTVTMAFDLWRIAVDGSVAWHKMVTAGTLPQAGSLIEQEVEVVENSQGELLLFLHAEINWAHRGIITKMSSTGSLIWNRQLGDPAVGWTFPCAVSSCFGKMRIQPDVQGGCLVMMPLSDMDENILLASLDTDGTFAWASHFEYLGVVNAGFVGNAVVDAQGNMLFLTVTTSLNGGLHVVRITPTGELERVDRYQPYTNCCSSLAMHEDTLLLCYYQNVYGLGTDGAVLYGSTARPLLADADSEYYTTSTWSNARYGRMVSSGAFLATPLEPGLPQASPTLSSFAVSDVASCARTSAMLPVHDVLPNSIFTCPPYAALDAQPLEATVAEATLDFEQQPLLAAIDLCVLTAIEPLTATVPAFTVNRTLLRVGDALTITSEVLLRCSIIDARGAMVWNAARPDQRTDVPTTQLASGLYTVLGRNISGQLVGTVKVVVEQ